MTLWSILLSSPLLLLLLPLRPADERGCIQYFIEEKRYTKRRVARRSLSSSTSSSSSSLSLLFVSTICVSKSHASPAVGYSQWMNSCSRSIDFLTPPRSVFLHVFPHTTAFRARHADKISSWICARQRDSKDSRKRKRPNRDEDKFAAFRKYYLMNGSVVR